MTHRGLIALSGREIKRVLKLWTQTVLAPILSGSTEILAWAMCFLAAAAVAWLTLHTQWTRPVRPPRPTRPIKRLRRPPHLAPIDQLLDATKIVIGRHQIVQTDHLHLPRLLSRPDRERRMSHAHKIPVRPDETSTGS